MLCVQCIELGVEAGLAPQPLSPSAIDGESLL